MSNGAEDDKLVGPEATAAVVRALADALTAWKREPGFEQECGERHAPETRAA